ncbi:hypothetical protein D3C72_2013030 [compost metagenome]
MGRAGVDHLDLAARGALDLVHHGHGVARCIVVKTQHHQVDPRDQVAFGGRVFAQLGRNADQLDLRHGLQALADLQTRGTGFAIDKDFGHGGAPAKRRQRLPE